MDKIYLTKQELKKFGLTMGLAFLVLGLIFFLQKKQVWLGLWPISFVFLMASLVIPVWLRPVYSFWMKFASILGWVNTRILLSLFFYFVLTPVGLIMKLFGKNPLDRCLQKERASYWFKRESTDFNPASYERQF